MDHNPPSQVKVWRCDGCGKVKGWKQRPPNHERFVGVLDDVDEALVPFITRIEPKYDQHNEPAYDPLDPMRALEVAFVVCGPFRRYLADPDITDFPTPLKPPTGPPARPQGDPNDRGSGDDIPF